MYKLIGAYWGLQVYQVEVFVEFESLREGQGLAVLDGFG